MAGQPCWWPPTKIPPRFYTLKRWESIESIRPPNPKDELFLSPKLGITIVENDDVPEVGWDLAGFPVFPRLFSDISPEGSVSRPMLWVPWPRFHGKKLTQKTTERCRRLRLLEPLGFGYLNLSTSPNHFNRFVKVNCHMSHILKHHPPYPQASSNINQIIRSTTRSSSTQHDMSASSADTDSSCVNTTEESM